MMTKSERAAHRRALDHAVAQQRLEGLTMSPETVAALKRVAKGKISTSDVIHELYTRYAHVKVQQL